MCVYQTTELQDMHRDYGQDCISEKVLIGKVEGRNIGERVRSWFLYKFCY